MNADGKEDKMIRGQNDLKTGDGIGGLLALSVRQPWAWLIVHGGKTIENRRWQTHVRGRFLVHAGKGMMFEEYESAKAFAEDLEVTVPDRKELQFGGIVGEAKIVGCLAESADPWFMGPFGFVLAEAKPLEFMPCKGALGWFRPQLEDAAKCDGCKLERPVQPMFDGHYCQPCLEYAASQMEDVD